MINEFQYQCIECGKTYSQDDVLYLCPSCSIKNDDWSPPKGVLKVIYGNLLEKASETSSLSTPISRFKEIKQRQFLDLLPIQSIDSLPKLKIGNTPLYLNTKIDGVEVPYEFYLKDDSQNPTYSFKDRASAIVSAYAKEKRFDTIIAASTGNAGSSLAGICASQGQNSIILVPETAPLAKLTQILMYGARLVPVKGNYDEAFDLSVKASKEFGWYNRNTAFNPLTIEGKKTVAFELFEQLGYTIPDRIFVPVGDGVIISGVYKGFEDLYNLGVVEKTPKIVAVQSTTSDNLVRNLNLQHFKSEASKTVADSISVDIPRNFYMTKDFINKYEGETICVSDEDILEASKKLSENTGLFVEPAAAAAFAGFYYYHKNKILEKGSKNVILLTGSGLKDLKAVENKISLPKSIKPDINQLASCIK